MKSCLTFDIVVLTLLSYINCGGVLVLRWTFKIRQPRWLPATYIQFQTFASNVNIQLLDAGLKGTRRNWRNWRSSTAAGLTGNLQKMSTQVIACNIYSISSISNVNIQLLDAGFIGTRRNFRHRCADAKSGRMNLWPTTNKVMTSSIYLISSLIDVNIWLFEPGFARFRCTGLPYSRNFEIGNSASFVDRSLIWWHFRVIDAL